MFANKRKELIMKATNLLLAVLVLLVIVSSIASLTVLFSADARAANCPGYRYECPWHFGDSNWYYDRTTQCCCRYPDGYTEC